MKKNLLQKQLNYILRTSIITLKSKASKATKLTYDRSTDNVDLFLPQTHDEYFPSEYLADDGHLIFSDEDHTESDGEGDSEMYAIDEEEDVEERDEGQ